MAAVQTLIQRKLEQLESNEVDFRAKGDFWGQKGSLHTGDIFVGQLSHKKTANSKLCIPSDTTTDTELKTDTTERLVP